MQRKMTLVVIFSYFEIIIVCFVVATCICDMHVVHAVEAMQFAVSRALLIFPKGFPNAVSTQER